MEHPHRASGRGEVVQGRHTEQPNPSLNAPENQSDLDADRLLENLKADPDTIRKLRFYESESKIALRQRLQNAMIASADRAVKARSARAQDRFWTINADANALVLSNASHADLSEIVDLLRREFDAAEGWERLEGAAS